MAAAQDPGLTAVGHLTPDGLDLFDDGRGVGIRRYGLRIALLDQEPESLRYERCAEDGMQAEGAFARASLTVRSAVRRVPGRTAVVVEHRLTNTGATAVHLASADFGQFAAGAEMRLGDAHGIDLRYACTDNVRSERYPYCQGEFPFVRNLPIHAVETARGEDQPFPAIAFTDRRYRHAIVVAAASQSFAFQTFAFQRSATGECGIQSSFAVRHDWRQSAYVRIEPGATLALDGVYVELLADVHPQDAWDGYVAWLAAGDPPRGARTPMLTEAMHCTWNYGVFAEQNQRDLLLTAEAIRRDLPGVRWFLVDAGYLTGDPTQGDAYCDRFYPDPEAGVDRERFPDGIRAFTDRIRALGLRPGIWWSPTARLDSQLYRDHPDWFLRDRRGGPYRIGGRDGFLDLTHPGALAFLDATLAVVLRAWGNDALKMDFWSQNVEDRNGLCLEEGGAGIAARTNLFGIVRRHLPEDGVFLTCVATGMGNPFIGRWADAYRNTIDIGLGRWHEQLLNCLWALPTLLVRGRDSFLLNNDSFGINVDAPRNENVFRLTWGVITQGMIETGGRIERLAPEDLELMRRLTSGIERGFKVRCPDERAFTGEPYPDCLYVDFPADSRTRARGVAQSVALFNWTDEPRVVAVRREALGQRAPARVRDFWSDAHEIWDDEFLIRRLDPRSALLFEVLDPERA